MLYFLPVDSALGSRQTITKAYDIKGKRVRASGWSADAMTRMGAAPILIASPEIYMALERGVIDGVFGFPMYYTEIMKLYEVAKYWTETWAGSIGIYATVINKKVWDTLPAKIKQYMEDLSDDVIAQYIKLWTDFNYNAMENIAATAEVDFYLWSDSEREIARSLVQPAQANAWMEQVNGLGLPAAEFMTRLKELLVKYETQSNYQSVFEIWLQMQGG